MKEMKNEGGKERERKKEREREYFKVLPQCHIFVAVAIRLGRL